MVRRVAVVPHTHWDREWYLPFQAFRMGLVQVLDEFLPRLEADPAFDRFLLDGQMAVIDDYLELRPEAAAVLQRLAEAGRLAVGPWYILMDEFLVSGETIIRNLQRGIERAADFGGAMAVGYLPDMFGHIAQMPQLLRLAGFDHAVVWRGVPAAIDRTAFWWQAPDGSTIRAEYLLMGYGNGAAMPDQGEALVRRMDAYLSAFDGFRLDDEAPVLWMNGTDHQAPQPWLSAVLAEANATQDRYHFAISSLPEYLAKAPADGLAAWPGELRAGARANLLMGVASNRVDIKIAAARAERALERVAEPLCALWLPPGEWPAAELRVAWTEVIRNSAHDSICACSHDRVATAVHYRFDEALTIAEGLRRRALRAAAAVMPVTGAVVVNPSARARQGVVEMVVPGTHMVAGGQVIESVPPAAVEKTATGAFFYHLLSQLAAEGFRPDEAGEITLEVGDTGVELCFEAGPTHRPDRRGAAILAEAEAQSAAHQDQPLRIRAERCGWQRVLVHTPVVPGFGWAAWEPAPLTVAPVMVDDSGVVSNGRLSVAVDRAGGTWSITAAGGSALTGLGRLVDDGDAGDTYNYSPPPADQVIDRPEAVAVEVVETGPLRAVVRITRSYHWPERLRDGMRVGRQAVAVTTDLELRAGEDLLRVTMAFDNQSRDHRLRAWFPLPTRATHSHAECAFAVVSRGLEAEGGPHEFGLPTFPSRRFVTAGGVTVLHEGLLEYELVEGGQALALTLLRATGVLSQPVMAYRDNAAGPAFPLEGPQMQGRVSVRYALHVGDRDPYELSDAAWVPLEVVEGAGLLAGAGGGGGAGGHVGSRRAGHASVGQVLAVTGAEVSALQRVDGRLELRVFNPAGVETTVGLGQHSGWLVDLRGVAVDRVGHSFPLRPWGIATVRLDQPEP